MEQQTTEIRALWNKAQERKAAISGAESGKFVTNGEFRFGNSGRVINITTERNEEVLVDCLAFLMQKEKEHIAARERLGLDKETFKWFGASLEEWEQDLKTRVTQLNLTKRKAELSKIEKTLLSLSPDLLRELELESIKAALA